MAAVATMKPGGEEAAQLTFPLIFKKNFTAGYGFFPSEVHAPMDLLLGETFQSVYHDEKARDARQSVYNGLANDKAKERKLLTGRSNYHLPKPVLGQRKFANPSLGAGGSSSSARLDGPGAPWQTIQHEMVGGVMRTKEGFNYYTKNLQARIEQLDKMNTLAQGLPVQRGDIIQPLSDSRFEGAPDKVEFFLLLQQLMDSVTDGDITRFSLDNLNKMIKSIFKFGPFADKEDFQDMVRAISDILLSLRQGIDDPVQYERLENPDYAITLSLYMEGLKTYVDEMFANMNMSTADRKTLSKSLIKTLEFNRLMKKETARGVVDAVRGGVPRVNQRAEDYDEDDDAPGGNGRFDRGGEAREDAEQGGVPRQFFADANQGGDPNRIAYGEARVPGARERELGYFGAEGVMGNQLEYDYGYAAMFPMVPGGAAAAAAAAEQADAEVVEPIALAEVPAVPAPLGAEEPVPGAAGWRQKAIYAYLLETGVIDDNGNKPGAEEVRRIFQIQDRDFLVSFAQTIPDSPYNPRTGTSTGTIINEIMRRLKMVEPTFK